MRRNLKNKILSGALAALMVFSTIAPVGALETVTQTSEDPYSGVYVESEQTASEESTEAIESTVDDEYSGVVIDTPEATSSEEVATPSEFSEVEETEKSIYDVASFNESFYEGLDFSSKRLIVITDDSSIFADESVIVSSFNNVYLLQFDDEDIAKEAYAYYYVKAEFVEVDTGIAAANGEDEVVVTDTVMTEDENPFVELTNQIEADEKAEEEALEAIEEAKKNGEKYEEYVAPSYDIALIDTGVSEASNITRISMLGDDLDTENTHGDDMVAAILEQNPDASILAIKALGEDGKGDVSAVYAAIEYAITQKVKVINLSMSAFATQDNSILAEAIKDAKEAGILVVGAAGNNGKDAKYYVPANIDDAIIVGACFVDGTAQPKSNKGDTVDYNVVAASTSLAAAKMSGWLSSNSVADIDSALNKGLIFATDYEAVEEPAEEPTEEGDGTFTAAADVSINRIFVAFKSGAEATADGNVWTAPSSASGHEFVFRTTYETSGVGEIAPGDMRIIVPAKLFKDASGAYADSYSVALPTEAEARDDTEFVYEINENGDIEVFNHIEIPAATSGYFDVMYTLTKTTWSYTDMTESDMFSADITVKDGSGNTVSDSSNEDSAIINTTASIDYTEKGYPTLYREWNDDWGEAPADADQYNYLIWTITSYVNTKTSQRYTFTLDDVVTGNIDNVEVVGYKFQGQSEYSPQNYVTGQTTIQKRFDQVLTRMAVVPDGVTEDYTVTIQNKITATVTPEDLIDAPTNAKSSRTFTYTPPKFSRPIGSFNTWKWGNAEWHRRFNRYWDYASYELYDLQDGSISSIGGIKYVSEFKGYPYPWTADFEAHAVKGPAVHTDGYDDDGNLTSPVSYESLDGATWTISPTDEIEVYDKLHIDVNFPDSSRFMNAGVVICDSLGHEIYAVYFNHDLEMYALYDWARDTDTLLSEDGSFDIDMGMSDIVLKWMTYPGPEEDTPETLDPIYGFYAYGYSEAYNDPLDPSVYGQLPVKYVFTDNELYLDGNEKQLEKGDYMFTSYDYTYTIRDAEYDPTTAKFVEKPAEFTEDDIIYFYGEYDGEYQLIGTYNLGTGESDYDSTYGTVSGSRVTFAQDCTGFKIETSNPYFYTYFYITQYVSLLNSDFVMGVIEGKDAVSLENWNKLDVYDYKDELIIGDMIDDAHDNIRGIESKSDLIKRVVSGSNDVLDRMYTITWSLQQSEYMTNADETVEPVRQDSGIFYDLLPKGANFVPNSVIVYDGEKYLSESDFTVETISNFKDSGQTMLVVKVNAQGTNFRVMYDTTHSWDAIADFGTKVMNLVAYETGNNKIAEGYPDNGAGITSAYREYFTDLDETTDANKFIYTSREYDINAITAATSGLTKKVMNPLFDKGFKYDTFVQPEGTYVYRLRYQNTDLTTSSNMVLFDTIENYKEKTSEWYGLLSAIDVTQMKAMGIEPVILYSTEVLDLDEHRDIDNDSAWSVLTDSVDFSTVKTIAIDARHKADGTDFVLEEGQSIVAYLYMVAPQASEVPEVTTGTYPETYNNIYISETVVDEFNGSEDFFIHQDYTTVKFKVSANVYIKKVSKLDNEEVIPNIRFRLLGTSDYGTEVDMINATGTGGTVSFMDIEAGTYTLLEYESTSDWLLDPTSHTVVISKQGAVTIDGQPYDNTYFVIEDTPREHADVKFLKRDSVNTTLGVSGALFKLEGMSDYGNDVLMYATSDNVGTVEFKDVELGTYKLTEVAPADGYTLNNTEWQVVVQGNGMFTITAEVVNGSYVIYDEPYHSITLYKISSYDKAPVAGAEFRLYGTSNTGTKVDMTAVSIESGYLTFENLEAGYYILEETVAPEGFALDATPRMITVNEDGSVEVEGIEPDEDGNINIVNVQKPDGSVTVIKKWVDGNPEDRPTPQFIIGTVIPDEADMAFWDTARWGQRDCWDQPGVSGANDIDPAKLGHIRMTPDLYTNTLQKHLPNENLGAVVSFERNTTYTEDQVKEIGGVRMDINYNDLNADARIYGWVEVDSNGETHFYWWSNKKLTGYTILEDPQGSDFNNPTFDRAEGGHPSFGGIVDVTTNLFTNLYNVRYIDMKDIIFDGLKTYSGFFGNDYNLQTVVNTEELQRNFSEVINTSYMFYNCTSLTAQALEDMGYKTWYTSKVYDMGYMFSGTSFASLDLSGWDVSRVQLFDQMFSQMYREGDETNNINLSGWQTLSASDMTEMFRGSHVGSLDLRHFNTSRLTNIDYMFSRCSKLTDINLNGWDISHVSSLNGVFQYCSALTSVDVGGWDTSHVANMSETFAHCTSLVDLDLSDWDVSHVTGYSNSWGGSGGFSSMFYHCESLKNLNITGWNTCSAVCMENMFAYCQSLETLDISDWDVSNVTSMQYMFEYCSSLPDIDLTRWNTQKLTNAQCMFEGCSSFVHIDLSTWTLPNCGRVYRMFYGCSNVETIDISGFSRSSDNDIMYMFYGDSKLTTIYASAFKGTTGNSPFTSCTSLVGGNGTTFSTSRNSYTYARVDEAGLPGYFTYKAPPTDVTYNPVLTPTDNGGESELPPLPELPEPPEPTFPPHEYEGIRYYSDDNWDATKTEGVNGYWSKLDDYTWAYTFYVYDENIEYWGWEENVPGYSESNLIYNPIYMEHGTDGGVITNTSIDNPSTGALQLTKNVVKGYSEEFREPINVHSYDFNDDGTTNGYLESNGIYVYNDDSDADFLKRTVNLKVDFGKVNNDPYGGSSTYMYIYGESGPDSTIANQYGYVYSYTNDNQVYYQLYLSCTYNGKSYWVYDSNNTGEFEFEVPFKHMAFVFQPSNGDSITPEDRVNGFYATITTDYLDETAEPLGPVVSHTANIDDDGVATSVYANNLSTTDVVTLDGAGMLDIEVWFATESASWDWLAIYPAGVTPASNNSSRATISNGKLGGRGSYTGYTKPSDDDTTYHRHFTANGDTAQFYFKSDSSGAYYGYYAIVTGYQKTSTTSVFHSDDYNDDGTTNGFLDIQTCDTQRVVRTDADALNIHVKCAFNEQDPYQEDIFTFYPEAYLSIVDTVKGEEIDRIYYDSGAGYFYRQRTGETSETGEFDIFVETYAVEFDMFYNKTSADTHTNGYYATITDMKLVQPSMASGNSAVAHTRNYNDDGTMNGPLVMGTTEGNSYSSSESAQIPGADHMTLDLHCNFPDYGHYIDPSVSIYASEAGSNNNHIDTVCFNWSTDKYSCGQGENNSGVYSFNIPSDVVTLTFGTGQAFAADAGIYGYFGTLTGYDADGNVVGTAVIHTENYSDDGTASEPLKSSGDIDSEVKRLHLAEPVETIDLTVDLIPSDSFDSGAPFLPWYVQVTGNNFHYQIYYRDGSYWLYEDNSGDEIRCDSNVITVPVNSDDITIAMKSQIPILAEYGVGGFYTSVNAKSLPIYEPAKEYIYEETEDAVPFVFKITLEDEFGKGLSGIQRFGNLVFNDGVAYVTLHDGETVSMNAIPAGYQYHIEEIDTAGYTAHGRFENGIIRKDTFVSSIFTNDKETDRELFPVTLSKVLTGTSANENDEFEFVASFSKLEPRMTYTFSDGTTFTSTDLGYGNAILTLKGGESVSIELPEGATYQFTEQESAYTASYNVTNANGDGEIASTTKANPSAGALSTAIETVDAGEDVTVEFTNEYNGFQNIKITKNVVDEKEEGTEFEFTIEFSNLDEGVSFISDVGKVTGKSDRTATKNFTLKNGETVEFYEVPVGVTYTITEAAVKRYVASYEIIDESDTNSIAQQTNANEKDNLALATALETVDTGENVEVIFTNTYSPVRAATIKFNKLINVDASAIVDSLIDEFNESGESDFFEFLLANEWFAEASEKFSALSEEDAVAYMSANRAGIVSLANHIASEAGVSGDDVYVIATIAQYGAEEEAFAKLALDRNEEYVFHITMTNTETGATINGVLSTEHGLTISNVPVGTYTVTEADDNYFDFVRMIGKYAVDGITFDGRTLVVTEDIDEGTVYEIDVTNETEPVRYYEDKEEKENYIKVDVSEYVHDVELR